MILQGIKATVHILTLFLQFSYLIRYNIDMQQAIIERRQNNGRRARDFLLDNIYKSSLKFLIPMTAEETYKSVVIEAVKLVGAKYGSIVLNQKNKLVRVYSSSPVAYKTIARKRGNTYNAYLHQRVIVSDIVEMGPHHPELISMGIKSTVFIPLSYKNKSMGVLTVNSTKNIKQSASDLEALKLFGALASMAIKKAQLHNELQHALNLRDLFISLAAHELRTPLTTLTVYLNLLKKRIQNGQDPTLEKWIDLMDSEATRLTHLIDELLTVNRVKTGKLQYNFHQISLREIVNRAALSFRITHSSRVLTYHELPEDVDDKIVGDFEKLLQVIINLLNNAAKFSDPTTPIILSCYHTNNKFNILITDQGQGISKEDLPYIFDGFYKGKNNQKQGMGLGLFLTKNIINMHKGSVKVKSELGKGTTVNIILRPYTI